MLDFYENIVLLANMVTSHLNLGEVFIVLLANRMKNRTSTFLCYVVRCGSRNVYPKDMALKEDWTTCSEYYNHIRFNNQHNWENLYDHLMSRRIFTFMMKNSCEL